MVTRSKKKNGGSTPPILSNEMDPNDDIDEHGNIKGLIDYDCDDDYDKDMLDKEIKKLRGGTTPTITKLKLQKKKKAKKPKNNKLADVLTSYIMMNLITQMTKSPKKSRKKGGTGVNDILMMINKKPNISMDIQELDKEKYTDENVSDDDITDEEEDIDEDDITDEDECSEDVLL